MTKDRATQYLNKIVSGGQTGVDRGALDAALAADFPCGGWCPEGRQAEDGTIADRYPLRVLAGAGYRERTEQNVIDSDATIAVQFGTLRGGTALTVRLCAARRRPCLIVDATAESAQQAADRVVRFIAEHQVAVLNTAGPRASQEPRGYDYARAMIACLLRARDSR